MSKDISPICCQPLNRVNRFICTPTKVQMESRPCAMEYLERFAFRRTFTLWEL